MFAFMKGDLVTASSEEVVIEVSGIGYRLTISAGTSRRLPPAGSRVFLFTHYHVREDLQQLFGFLDEAELQLFRLLLSITGVGPKLAMAVLSGLSVSEIRDAIVSNRPETLFGITGVGRKTAARIILELRDKILKTEPPTNAKGESPAPSSRINEDAVSALMTLGFARTSALKAVMAVLEATPDLSVESIVRSALTAIHNYS